MPTQNSPRGRSSNESEFSPDFGEHPFVSLSRIPHIEELLPQRLDIPTPSPRLRDTTTQDLAEVQSVSVFLTERSLVLERFTGHMTLVSISVISATILAYQGAVGGEAGGVSESGYSLAGLVVLAFTAVFAMFARRHSRTSLIALYMRQGADRVTAKARANSDLANVAFPGQSETTRS